MLLRHYIIKLHNILYCLYDILPLYCIIIIIPYYYKYGILLYYTISVEDLHQVDATRYLFCVGNLGQNSFGSEIWNRWGSSGCLVVNF